MEGINVGMHCTDLTRDSSNTKTQNYYKDSPNMETHITKRTCLMWKHSITTTDSPNVETWHHYKGLTQNWDNIIVILMYITLLKITDVKITIFLYILSESHIITFT